MYRNNVQASGQWRPWGMVVAAAFSVSSWTDWPSGWVVALSSCILPSYHTRMEKSYTMPVVSLKWYPIPTKVQCAHTTIK